MYTDSRDYTRGTATPQKKAPLSIGASLFVTSVLGDEQRPVEAGLERERLVFNRSKGNFGHQEEETMAVAYCMKCKKKVEIKNPKQITTNNSRLAVRGVCSVCGTKVFRIGKL